MTPKVLPLDLSKELVENGIVLETEFWWYQVNENGQVEVDLDVGGDLCGHYPKIVPAPLAEEILENMPWRFETEKGFYVLNIEKGGKPWYWVNYCLKDNLKYIDVLTEEAPTLVSALGKMLIHLAKEELL